MNETNYLLRHILALDSTTISNDSTIDLRPTVDPDITRYVRDGFFLSVVVLLFLNILKLIYISMVLFYVMTAKDESQTSHYPPSCNLCCDIISCVFMIIMIFLGLYSIISSELSLTSGILYLTTLICYFLNDFVLLITVCNTERHTEYSLSYGLISMALVITESLSLNVGFFFMYFSYLQWKEENRDKNIQFWPFF